MSDTTSKSILEVRFREKVRGYHQGDVDSFVSQVAATVEELQARAAAAEARVAELQSQSGQTADAEDSLRRTLVLAQRTADLAVEEARAEAARLVGEAEQQRDALLSEVAEMRTRLVADTEQEIQAERERLFELRRSLQADVEALRGHLERERERLRIYFTDQLRRLDEGEPGVAPAPEMQAPVDAAAAGPDQSPEAVSPEGPVAGAPMAAASVGGDSAAGDSPHHEEADEEDPFLAELRRAVTDEQPLGPREVPGPQDDDADFDLFAREGEQVGRFGPRRRRRRDG